METELEMVRAAWLLQHRGIVRSFCWLSCLDRIQRSEIDRRLQRRLGQSKGASCGHRSTWFACHGRISCFRKHERERRLWRSQFVHTRRRSKRERNDLRVSEEVTGPVELFGIRLRNRKNASTDRSSPEPDAGKFALVFPVKPAINRLSVSAILFGILGGILGIAAGLFLGFALGAALAAALHVPSREGESGYFAVAIALIVTCIVAPVSTLVTIYWRGVRSIWLFIGLVMVCVSMAAIGASGLGIWYAAQPHVLNLNGPTPLLEFEVKPPVGQSLEALANVESQLDTERNSMPGYWHTEAPENPGVRAGYVELYFRTSQRLFVLKFPGREDRIFNLHLPTNPMKAKYRVWSEWQNPDLVTKAGEQPSRFSGGSDYLIRYKLNYRDR